MIYVSLLVAGLALLFTVASFWWLQARKGRITAATPRTYAFVDKPRLRLPFAFFNTGARPLIVSDLRIVIYSAEREPLPWITTRDLLRPEDEDGFAFAMPFAVPGRGTREVIAEFGDSLGWTPDLTDQPTVVTLQARIHPSNEWSDVASFGWWAPPAGAELDRYIAYENGRR